MLIPLLSLATPASASLSPRQSVDFNSTSITTSIKQLRAAIFTISQITIPNSSAACNDESLIPNLNSTSVDGNLAHTLLCEDAVGVHIFPDISQAELQLQTALSSLQNATAITSCSNVTLNSLDQAGINSTAILAQICPPSNSAATWNNTSSMLGPFATGGVPSANASRIAPRAEPSVFITTLAGGAELSLNIDVPLTAALSTDLAASVTGFITSTRSATANDTVSSFALDIPLTVSFETTLTAPTSNSIPARAQDPAMFSTSFPSTESFETALHDTTQTPSSETGVAGSSFSVSMPLTGSFETTLISPTSEPVSETEAPSGH